MELTQQLKNTYTDFKKTNYVDFSSIRQFYRQLSDHTIKCNQLPESEINYLVNCCMLFVEHLLSYVEFQMSHVKHIHGLEKRLDILVSILKIDEIKETYIKLITVQLLPVIVKFNTKKWLTRALTRNFMVIVKSSNQELKHTGEPAKMKYLLKIFDEIRGYGDFEHQFLLIELIMTIFPPNILKVHVNSFLSDELQTAFLRINENNKAYEIRTFLNRINLKYNKVFSFEFQHAITDEEQILPFTDQLWVDFNVSSKCITIPCKASSFLLLKECRNDTEIVNISFKDVSTVTMSALIENQLKSTHRSSIFFRLNGPCVILPSELVKREYLKLELSDPYETDRLENKVLPSLFKEKFQKVMHSEGKSAKTARARRFGIGKYRPLGITKTRLSQMTCDSDLFSESGTTGSVKSLNSITKDEDQRGSNKIESDFRKGKENLQNNQNLLFSKLDRLEFFKDKFNSNLNYDKQSDNRKGSSDEFLDPEKRVSRQNKLQMYLQKIEEFSKISENSQFDKRNKFPEKQNLIDFIEISDDEEKQCNNVNDLNEHKLNKTNVGELKLTGNDSVAKESMIEKNSHISAFGLKKSPNSVFGDTSSEEMLSLQSEIDNSGTELIVDVSEKDEGTKRGFPSLAKNEFLSKAVLKSGAMTEDKLNIESKVREKNESNQHKDRVPRLVQNEIAHPKLKGISTLGLREYPNSDGSTEETVHELLEIYNSDIELIADGLENDESNQIENGVTKLIQNKFADPKLISTSTFGLRESQNSDDGTEENVHVYLEIHNSGIELIADRLEKDESNQTIDGVTSKSTSFITTNELRESQISMDWDLTTEQRFNLQPEVQNSSNLGVAIYSDQNKTRKIRDRRLRKNILLQHISAFGLQESQTEICNSSFNQSENNESNKENIILPENDFTSFTLKTVEKENMSVISSRQSQNSALSGRNTEKRLKIIDNLSDGLDKDESSPVLGGNWFLPCKLKNANAIGVTTNELTKNNHSDNSSNEIILTKLNQTVRSESQTEKMRSSEILESPGKSHQTEKINCPNFFESPKKSHQTEKIKPPSMLESAAKSLTGNTTELKKMVRSTSKPEKINSSNIFDSVEKSVNENTTQLNKTVTSESHTEKMRSSKILEYPGESHQTEKIKSLNIFESAKNTAELSKTLRSEMHTEKMKSPKILESAETSHQTDKIKCPNFFESPKKSHETEKIKPPSMLESAAKSLTGNTTELKKMVRSKSKPEKINSSNIFDSVEKSVNENTTQLNKTVTSESHTEKMRSSKILEYPGKSHETEKIKSPNIFKFPKKKSQQTEQIKHPSVLESAAKPLTKNTTKLKKTVGSKSKPEKIKSPNIFETVEKSFTEDTTKPNNRVMRSEPQTEKIQSPKILESPEKSHQTEKIKSSNNFVSVGKSITDNIELESHQAEKIKSPNILESTVNDIHETASKSDSYKIKKRKTDARNFVNSAKRLKIITPNDNDPNLSKDVQRSDRIKENSKKIRILQNIIIRHSNQPKVDVKNRIIEPEIIAHECYTPPKKLKDDWKSVKTNPKFLSFVRSYTTQLKIPLHDDYKPQPKTGLNGSLINNYEELSKVVSAVHEFGIKRSAETELVKVIKELFIKNNGIYKLLQEKCSNPKIQNPHHEKLLLLLNRLTQIFNSFNYKC